MQFSRGLHRFVFKLHGLRSGLLELMGAAIVVAGCATAPGIHTQSAYAGKPIEDQVRDRAAKRWQALIAGDLDAAYGFFSPATKATYPIELYRVKMRPGMWRDAKVEMVKCADQVCDVTVVLTLDHSRLKGIVTPVAERWIVQDGLAWYVYNG
jgi:hypothetical protein